MLRSNMWSLGGRLANLNFKKNVDNLASILDFGKENHYYTFHISIWLGKGISHLVQEALHMFSS